MQDFEEVLELVVEFCFRNKEFKEEHEKEEKLNTAKEFENDIVFTKLALKSRYQHAAETKDSLRLKYKMEKAERLDLYRLKPSKLAEALTYIDLMLYKDIRPIELVNYDGSECSDESCKTLCRFKLKNQALTSFTQQELGVLSNFKYFYKLARHLLSLRNYNSFDAILSGIRTQELEHNQLEKITELMKDSRIHLDLHKVLQEKIHFNEFLVPPLNLVLKDIQSSNCNKENEMASMKFCKTIEFLVYTQNLEPFFRVKRKYEHLIIYKINQTKIEKGYSYDQKADFKCLNFLIW